MYEVLGYLFKAGSFWVTLVCILKPMRNKQKEANRVDEHMCSLAREHEFILCVRLLFSATSDTTDFSTDSMQYTFPSSQRQHYERNGSTRERDELRYVITNNNVIMQPHSWEMKTNLIWLFYTVSLCLSLPLVWGVYAHTYVDSFILLLYILRSYTSTIFTQIQFTIACAHRLCHFLCLLQSFDSRCLIFLRNYSLSYGKCHFKETEK